MVISNVLSKTTTFKNTFVVLFSLTLVDYFKQLLKPKLTTLGTVLLSRVFFISFNLYE